MVLIWMNLVFVERINFTKNTRDEECTAPRCADGLANIPSLLYFPPDTEMKPIFLAIFCNRFCRGFCRDHCIPRHNVMPLHEIVGFCHRIPNQHLLKEFSLHLRHPFCRNEWQKNPENSEKLSRNQWFFSLFCPVRLFSIKIKNEWFFGRNRCFLSSRVFGEFWVIFAAQMQLQKLGVVPSSSSASKIPRILIKKLIKMFPECCKSKLAGHDMICTIVGHVIDGNADYYC